MSEKNKTTAAAGQQPAPTQQPDAPSIDPAMYAMFQAWLQATHTGPTRAALQAEKAEQESIDRLEKLKVEFGKPLAQRNAEMIRAKYGDGPKLFSVRIPKDKAQPALKIPASSPEEADGRYRAFCGIRSTDHNVEVIAA